MKLHTDTLTRTDLRLILKAEKKAGRIADTVFFKVLTEHGSRFRRGSLEIQLASPTKDVGDDRRTGRGGSHANGDGYAATFEEWGYLLAAVFSADEIALAGPYSGAFDFDAKTGGKFPVVAA